MKNLEIAIKSIQAGNLPEGARLLQLALKADNLDGRLRAIAYMWLAETQSDREFKLYCYQQAISADPEGEQARLRLQILLSSQLPPTNSPATTPAPVAAQPSFPFPLGQQPPPKVTEPHSEESTVKGEGEDVGFTHFYPAMLELDSEAKLHVYVHLLSAIERVRADFEQRNQSDVPQLSVTQPGSLPFERGTTFTIVPSIKGIRVKPERIDVAWEEDFEHVEFSVKPTAGVQNNTGITGHVRIFVDTMIVAELPVVAMIGTTFSKKFTSQTTQRYRKIFISYSHKDALIVKSVDRLYAKYPEMITFIDYKFLQASDEWWPAIQTKITDAEALQLFWSANSSVSPNVADEWHFALKLPRPIVPIMLEPKAEIPAELNHIHFEDFERFIERL